MNIFHTNRWNHCSTYDTW